MTLRIAGKTADCRKQVASKDLPHHVARASTNLFVIFVTFCNLFFSYEIEQKATKDTKDDDKAVIEGQNWRVVSRVRCIMFTIVEYVGQADY